MNMAITQQRPLSLAMALGTLGGATLVLAKMFFVSGKYILIPYAILVIGTAIVLRTTRITNFTARFVAGLGGFMLASVALYAYILLVEIPRVSGNMLALSPLGHIWRLGFLLLIGAALNLAVARVSE